MNKLFCNKELSRFALLIVLIFSSCILASSATFTVTKIADTNDSVCDADCSLREAIGAANAVESNDVIEFEATLFSSAQVIVAGDMQINSNGTLTINGKGSNLLTFDGLNALRVFSIRSGANITINDVKITRGNGRGSSIFGGGGIHNFNGTLIINRSIISNNTATGNNSGAVGGAIYNGGKLTLNDSTVDANTAHGGHGGAIYNDIDSSLTVSNSTISNNTAEIMHGGAIYNLSGVTTTITKSIISNNKSWGGGGIFNSSGTMNITDSTFTNNILTPGDSGALGGAIRHDQGSMFIGNSNFISNAAASGGAVSNRGTANISNSTFNGNTAFEGSGGAILNSGMLTVTKLIISNNKAVASTSFTGGKGGGISTGGSTVLVESVNIINNTAVTGGGIFSSNGNLTIQNSTISGNSIKGQGGGIYCEGGTGTVDFTNSTISNNTTTNVGGGIYNYGGNNLNFNNTTINNNRANIAGGVFNHFLSTVNSRNSIVADNANDITNSDSAPDYYGKLVSQGYNLIENTSNTTIIGILTGNILGQDPQLLPLGDYGGISQTVALQPSSPAIDAADPNNFPEFDQRDVLRPQDGDVNGSALPDMGAYERQVKIFTVTKISDSSGGTCETDCSLREAIAAANSATTLDNAIVFDASTFNAPQTITLTDGELVISGNKTILVKGSRENPLTIDANTQSRVLFIESGAAAAFTNVKITGGNGIGANFSGHGGAIYVRTNGFLILKDSIVTANYATLSDTNGLHYPELVMNKNTLIAGSVIGGGGGIFNLGKITLDGSELSNNKIILSGVSATGGGGGMANFGTASINKSTISNNNADVSADAVSSGGGGIYNGFRGDLTLTNSTVSRNTAQGNGGGINNNIESRLTVNNSTISNNAAKGSSGIGGGIFNFEVVSLINSTIVDNTSQFNGGGIYNLLRGSTRPSIVNSRNTIIGNNTTGTFGPDFSGALTSQGYNLIENTEETTISGTTTGNILGRDPHLLPLGNYGGLTQTHALRSTSPAIDKGTLVSGIITDQRGLPRPFDFPSITNAAGGNGSDIGAYERQSSDISGTTPFDFDGDGKSDPSIFRLESGVWHLLQSQSGYAASQFGLSTDKIVPADYDSDGKTDLAVFRENSSDPGKAKFFILQSSNNQFREEQFGSSGDIPVSGDWDGDGKSDIGVYRQGAETNPQGYFYYRPSSQPATNFVPVPWGIMGDKPVIADFDGDGKTDAAVFRPSNGVWYVQQSRDGFSAIQFGAAEDKPIPSDYDGDGKADQAVFRPSNGVWYIWNSRIGFTAAQFGISTDKPVPADYDGDGKTDIAVYRDGTWFISNSTSGFVVTNFGNATDKPIANSFVP